MWPRMKDHVDELDWADPRHALVYAPYNKKKLFLALVRILGACAYGSRMMMRMMVMMRMLMLMLMLATTAPQRTTQNICYRAVQLDKDLQHSLMHMLDWQSPPMIDHGG